MSDHNLKQLQEQLQERKGVLARRFDELAQLTQQLEHEQAAVDQLQQRVEVLEAKAAEVRVFTLELTDEERAKNNAHIELIASSDLFDAEWYLETYPDIGNSKKFAENPAVHYTLFGAFEGRKPCPEFDSAFYLQQNRDVSSVGMNPLAHYLRFGRGEGRQFAPPVDDE